MKTLTMVWCYLWAYVFILLEKMDKLGDWIANQIDHNDYLAGFVFGVCLFAIPYIIGIIDIVTKK